MIFKKILNFFDQTKDINFQYGKLYKIQNECLAFRYVFIRGDDIKGLYRFKHHQLKEYIFDDLSKIERTANPEECRLYNLIKEHVNELAGKKNNFYHN